MARLIDADKIKYHEHTECVGHGDFETVRTVTDKEIAEIPTVETVEVVRCRDCAKDGLFTCPICFIENKTLRFINHSPDFYCGEGERKDGGGNA